MLNYSRNRGREDKKENDGGGEFNYDILLRTFVNVTMYPQDNNNAIKKNFLSLLTTQNTTTKKNS
jgi:hypothetical protein